MITKYDSNLHELLKAYLKATSYLILKKFLIFFLIFLKPNNIINVKLPRDDIVRRAQTPLCKSMVQLHSRRLDDDDQFNSTTACDNLDNLDHLMINDRSLQAIRNNQELRKRILNKKGTNSSLRTSRSTGLIHQRSSNTSNLENQSMNHHNITNLESNHYCCTNISTGLTEITINNGCSGFNKSTPSQLAFENSATNMFKKCSSCSNNSLTCFCASTTSNEPIYMLPSLKEQTEALSLEYPSNVVAINTDQIQFTRMSSFRKSLIHVSIFEANYYFKES